MRPIGAGEASRCIISKAILSVIQVGIRHAVESRQFCIGQKSGCEADIHTVNKIHNDKSTEGIIMVDASIAFNSLNYRNTTLVNALRICPALSTVLVNTYRSHPCLFIDGETMLSKEETTQGDPIAIWQCMQQALSHHFNSSNLHHRLIQIWYADDSAAGGQLKQLQEWCALPMATFPTPSKSSYL